MIKEACIFIAMHLPGGSIAAQEAKIAELDAQGCRIEIHGECLSSCTMFLGARDVCVHPRAMLGFHSSRGGHFGGLITRPSPWPVQDEWDRRMAAYYPPALQRWFLEDVRHRGFHEWAWVSGREIARHGIAACENLPPPPLAP